MTYDTWWRVNLPPASCLLPPASSQAIREKRPTWSSRLEKWSRILWPVLFVGLTIPYVTVLLTRDDHQCKGGEKIKFNTSFVQL